jgi:tetratricopeptide (TPR) repeat protein
MHQEQGFALLREGRMPEAAAALEQALALGVTDPLVRLNLAIACMNTGEWLRAGSAMRAYLKEHPGDAMGHVRMGVILRELKNYDAAGRTLRHALELDPSCAAAHFHLAELHAAQKNWEAARDAYKRAIEMKPTYAEAYAGLGNVCAERNLPGPAMEFYNRALALSAAAQRGAIYGRVGRLLAQHERWHEAANAFEQAIGCGEGSDEINYDLALAYLHDGNREGARQQMLVLKSIGSHLARRLEQIMGL